MTLRAPLVVLVFLAFTAFTAVVIAGSADGYFGFVTLALRDRWALQMLLDVSISAALFFFFWIVPDARREGISVWPYVVAIVLTGSIGALAYVIHREIKRARAGRRDLPARA